MLFRPNRRLTQQNFSPRRGSAPGEAFDDLAKLSRQLQTAPWLATVHHNRTVSFQGIHAAGKCSTREEKQ